MFLDEHYGEIFKKYSDEELIKDINNYKYKKGRLTKTLNHFFEEVIYECRGPRGNKSPMDALKNDNDINYILEYTKTKPNFYTGDNIQNIKSFFRNAGKLAQKVANFSPTTARDIYFRYHDINGETLNILDTSAGFGSRMSAVLLSGHNYYGIDPNKNLFIKLNEYYNFLVKNSLLKEYQKCNLYCTGSENFIPDLVNSIDISFTSPPYFNLEFYSNDGNKSTIYYNDYNKWLNEFVKPTINNIYMYLKTDGIVMINIKNLTRGKKQPLFDDWFKLFNEHSGFEYVETFEMHHQSKKNYFMNANYSLNEYHGFKEPVMVFRKKEIIRCD